MYLKRLELHGFKTFATRTALDFEGGVTGVVGPNGSGKSNLADAVRWALGEQNMRNVRCRQADDLIFAGTTGQGARATRRAPMNMAEVMLTFDNADGWLPVDYQEVRIGRRAYRSGENEYLMNGSRVRLRDITDLLSRASISTGGHIVIGQGLVDTVLSQRPEERRALVETLAGLRFYYSRRDDAENKVRTVEANLHNVDAMIAEGSPHLAHLREQAAAYGQYHAVERDLRDLLLLHYAHATAQATEKRERLAAELAAAQQRREEVKAEVQAADHDLAAAREHVRSMEGAIHRLRGEIRTVREARDARERELAVGRARREGVAARLDDLRTGLAPLEARRSQAVTERDGAAEAVRALEAEQSGLQQRRDDVERAVQAAAAQVASVDRSIRTLAERRRTLESQATTAAAELAALEREESTAQAERQRYTTDQQATAKGLSDATAAVATARAALDVAAARVEEARAAESHARLLAADGAERARQTAAARRDAQRRAEELRSRAGGLQTWLHASSGMAPAGTSTDMPGLAAVLVTPPDLNRAIAAALGPALNAGLADVDMGVDAAARALGGGARGVLTPGRVMISPRDQDALVAWLAERGVGADAIVGWANRVVEIEIHDRRLPAVQALLSLVLIVRDLSAAWRAHCALRGDTASTSPAVLVTLHGDALRPDGLLHRPEGDGATVLERASELREVLSQAAAAEHNLSDVATAAERAEDERLQRASAAESAGRALRAAEHERAARRNDVGAAERAETQARRDAQWAAERARQAMEREAARVKRRGEIQARADAARAALSDIARDEAPLARAHEEARGVLAEATARRAEHGAAVALAVGRIGDARRTRSATADALARLDDEIRSRRAGIERLESEAHQLSAADETLSSTIGEAVARLRVLHEQLRPLDQESAATEQRIVDLGQRLATLRPADAQASTAHESAALALQRAEHELETVMVGLQNDLALDPVDLPAPAAPPAGLPQRIKALRARLVAFGPVNARAPEDLASATERQEFLETQAADLREGVARLRALIAEANATVRERFGAVAGEMDAHFRIYLQQLFNGGHGELTAMYDAAGLPSGLEIAVQPPGKRTRDLALLSGGERALVGLALVFAMLAVRPVPFCVLDEAEAALDEANTLRIGEILRSLSARTQFIVITHNRGTMSHADALYGVTMAETGISQVAGLRLEDVKLERQSRAG